MSFSVLLVIFAAVGFYLVTYSTVKSLSLKAFGRHMGLSYKDKDDGSLERDLNEKFGYEEHGRLRSFAQIKDLVSDGEVTLFRCIELLDLNPYRRVAVTHSVRFAVTFAAPRATELFFKIDDKGKYYYIDPRDVSQDEHFAKIKAILDSYPPRHWLSVTFNDGRAVIYLMPLVVGSEDSKDFEYLFKVAGEIKKAL